MEITNYEFEKYSSLDYSLLDDQWRLIKRRFLFPLGLYLPIIGFIFSFILYYHISKRYKLVNDLKNQYQIREITALYKSGFDYWRNGFCIYALVDLKDREVIHEIVTLLDNPEVKNHTPTRVALEKAQKVHAIKLNYDKRLKY